MKSYKVELKFGGYAQVWITVKAASEKAAIAKVKAGAEWSASELKFIDM